MRSEILARPVTGIWSLAGSLVILLLLAGCETADMSTARIANSTPEQMLSVDDRRLCGALSWGMRRTGTRDPKIDREVLRRNLDCTAWIEQDVSNCSELKIVQHYPHQQFSNVYLYVVSNNSGRRMKFRVYYQSIGSSEFQIMPGETKEVGVSTPRAIGSIAAGMSAARGQTRNEPLLTDCFPVR
jgi:hypothetical protein